MRRNRDKEPLFNLDPEPERTLRRRLQQAQASRAVRNLRGALEQEAEDTTVAANLDNGRDTRKVLGSYTAPNFDSYGRSISIPAIDANNFELKPQLVTLVQ
ncbi:hypothetical protein AHAS_Ahas17G0203300 [Arachis hypogaea]